MRKRYQVAVTGILVTAMLISIIPGCGKKDKGGITQNPGAHQESQTQSELQTDTAKDSDTQKGTQTETQKDSETQVETQKETQTESQKNPDKESQKNPDQEPQKEPEKEPEKEPQKPAAYVPQVTPQTGVGIEHEVNPAAPWIAIDAGHQGKGNYEKEPIGPGASETKAKVSSGTEGTTTKVPEYELTLAVSIRLRDALMAEGYNVLMIRETNDVNISNAERATLANEKGVSAFIRIHADGADSASASGITVLCQTKNNPYCSAFYTGSRNLSDWLSKEMVNATGAKNRGISEVDNMSGINWCKVPVAIVEMGFMTNANEDQLMQTEDYQKKLVTGMVSGIKGFLTD